IINVIYLNVYYPTYSNSLKEIGGYLGCKWSVPPSYGAESFFLREWGEEKKDDSRKENLIQYKLEDFRALEAILFHLRGINEEAITEASASEEKAIALAEEAHNPSDYRKWGPGDYATDEFKRLAECAYFDYQRSKIRLRATTKLRRLQRRASKGGTSSY